ncbi:MAG: DNA mismatch repair protein MutS [Planctomycetota bacterium]
MPPAAGKDPRDTPAMRQHAAFKARHPDALLLFRMGDFYECFDDDALVAHRTLGITLTERTSGLPMAGVPYHSVESYIKRLIDAGVTVAVVDQIQDPSEAKGVVERAVTRVLTPGTLVEDALLDEGRANTLAAIAFLEAGNGSSSRVALAFVEVSTGAFSLSDCAADDAPDELLRRGAQELIYAETATGERPPRLDALAAPLGIALTPRPAWQFRAAESLELLREHYAVVSLAGFGLDEADPALPAAGAVLRYLRETQAMHEEDALDESSRERFRHHIGDRTLAHLAPPARETEAGFMRIDAASIRALEIERTIRGDAPSHGARTEHADGSLAGLFATRQSSCKTAMGRRLLRDWLCRPLADLDAVRARHACVAAFVSDRRLASELAEQLAGVQDVPRIAARVALNRASPRDLVGLGGSLSRAEAITALLDGAPALAAHHARLVSVVDALQPIARDIADRCVDDPPAHLRDGGLIRDGVDAELDEARTLQRDAGEWLARYQGELIERFDLPSLKVGFNKVFGYYIELPSAQARRAPDVFTRKQTLKNAERYITPELKAYEDKVLGAADRAIAREQVLFAELCAAVRARAAEAARYAACVAELDVVRCFAERAVWKGWARPEMVETPVLSLGNLRHAVLEEVLGNECVGNDCALGTAHGSPDHPSLSLITGPNMAGKSTYIRSVALAALLAHAGSFVPADTATIGLTDRLFTRIGADDALHRGQSTFMVEMVETANILHHATNQSLVILDEIGRGTSTLDGLSLAWSIVEQLAGVGVKTESVDHPAPRTLFATHYHELTTLAERHAGRIANLHAEAREFNDQIIFLHRITPGAAPGSFGVQVARLAGVPDPVIARARELLANLSVSHAETERIVDGAPLPAAPSSAIAQLPLFAAPDDHPAVAGLRELKIESMTPLEAFDALRALAESARATSEPRA